MLSQEACVRMAKPTPVPAPGHRETGHLGHGRALSGEDARGPAVTDLSRVCCVPFLVRWRAGGEETQGPREVWLSHKDKAIPAKPDLNSAPLGTPQPRVLGSKQSPECHQNKEFPRQTKAARKSFSLRFLNAACPVQFLQVQLKNQRRG